MDVSQLLYLPTVVSAMLVAGVGYILRWASQVNAELASMHEKQNDADRRLDAVEHKVYDGK